MVPRTNNAEHTVTLNHFSKEKVRKIINQEAVLHSLVRWNETSSKAHATFSLQH
jgi:1-deoxy-D-xylulose 5-phosphate reductoisomerase